MSLYAHRNHDAGQVVGTVVCDLRSDTVTRPDEAMREAMASADVGDDVYGEDPSVLALEQRLAEMLNKNAAVFFPSGTQSNLAAVLAHCGRGDEAMVGSSYHVLCSEAAGAAVLGGVALSPVPVQVDGSLGPGDVAAAVKPDDPHYPRTRLLCLENTVSGQAVPLAQMQAAAAAARTAGLSVHLDGARFFNAVTALGIDAKELSEVADSVSICLSKGLGAPVGSVLVGDSDTISKARRNRKILGGAMRQAGVLAAAGLHALENNVKPLAEDHRRAAQLGEVVGALPCDAPVRQATSMVFFTPCASDHSALRAFMTEQGVLLGAQSPTIRIVLHRDVDDDALDHVIGAFRQFYKKT